MNRANILVVEDEAGIQGLIRKLLEKEGHRVRVAGSVFSAQGELQRMTPDLVILDRQMPDGDGLEVCKLIRSQDKTRKVPVLFLTSKTTTTDKVVGLRVGGDDYLTKPFQLEELLARVDALLRRAHGDAPVSTVLQAHGITLDLDKHECTLGQQAIVLWPKEFEILRTFMERPGRLLNKEYLSEKVWGHEFLTSSRAVDIAVQRLRKKLGKKQDVIETVKGYGYRFQEE